MSKITNDGLTRSNTGFFYSCTLHGNSGRQRVNLVSKPLTFLCCRHSDDDDRLYTFSSPPTVVAAPRLYVSPPSSADAPQKLSPDTPLQPDSTMDDGRSENEWDSSQITAASISPVRLDSDSEKLLGATDSRLSPMLQSVRRSSLREIPETEIRRSGVSCLSILLCVY